jgi:xanthine dehydrogenase accessory factor
MYEIALTVEACLRARTTVDVAWAVDGFAERDRGEALALTPGGGRVGSLLGGALDDQLSQATRGRLLGLHVGDLEAQLAGLGHDGDVRCLLLPAADLPAGLWPRLRDREPVCLIARLDGDRVVETALYGTQDAPDDAAGLVNRGVSVTAVGADAIVTVLFPVPRLVIVGAGPIPEALGRAAALLGWRVDLVNEAGRATGLIAGLASLDKLVVAAHDNDLAGSALAAALETRVGYIGSVGSRTKQRERADWLAYRDITDLDRLHGPAGLDIGARTPAEIAVSILAEAVAAGAQVR